MLDLATQVALGMNGLAKTNQTTQVNKEVPRIISVKELLSKPNLTIPDYQRPYKWSIKNVNQLIDDILLHRDKSAYRIGTLVLHQIEDTLNIVDGQQRTITLLLMAMALQNHLHYPVKEDLIKHHYQIPKTKLFDEWEFSNPISQKNIHQNYREVKRRMIDFDAHSIRFFYEKCELVQVVLNDVSEAFQFFDSQNARGRDLDPHDLLKAFHLRELTPRISEQEKMEIVSHWESLETDDLKKLFAQLLFRVRYWSKGHSARFFTKNEVDAFKGISPDAESLFPYTEIYKIGHYFVDDYNTNYHRKIDKQHVSYPFQLNQVMINGKRFFEFVNHYWNVREVMYAGLYKNDKAKAVLEVIDKYPERYRTGDAYVRTLFDCALLFYWDKFGNAEIGRIAEKIFVWAYKLRLTQHSVQLASIDNYALEAPYVFKTINEALAPKDVLNLSITPVKLGDLKGKELKSVLDQVKNLGYYEA
ncbi:DUF262 domain-containing protein [Flavisolibacter ginsenosidimutans]|uniref:DUF262 domain-containing protein n=1 Tax=Flavisolibacter ginsenosidimutans TaxID=661481 RepID=A0A5B8UIW4_9BACT|nr:DUF262 domain-containing protein [Flavisolibacter ginsenosidimutans]QEC56631.1 DUF262 domain-containing protein [Flavisolibacter ginsenosidimutans]